MPKSLPMFLLLAVFLNRICYADEPMPVTAVRSLHCSNVGDQDDLCFWKHPSDFSQSQVITSDKKSNRLFVYDLKGTVRQTVELSKPGNIDIRQNLKFGEESFDLVAVNIRSSSPMLRVFRVNAVDGKLIPIDGDGISTKPNYGGCLASDRVHNRTWFVCTSENNGVSQYELTMDAERIVRGKHVRAITLGKCEGAVADDASGKLFIAVENEGVWQFPIDPSDASPGELIIRTGENGLKPDVEGLALSALPDHSQGLVVSSQGASKFFVFERHTPWSYRGAFRVDGAKGTDGIDLIQSSESSEFPGGIFGCHTDSTGHPIILTAWDTILKNMTARPQ